MDLHQINEQLKIMGYSPIAEASTYKVNDRLIRECAIPDHAWTELGSEKNASTWKQCIQSSWEIDEDLKKYPLEKKGRISFTYKLGKGIIPHKVGYANFTSTDMGILPGMISLPEPKYTKYFYVYEENLYPIIPIIVPNDIQIDLRKTQRPELILEGLRLLDLAILDYNSRSKDKYLSGRHAASIDIIFDSTGISFLKEEMPYILHKEYIRGFSHECSTLSEAEYALKREYAKVMHLYVSIEGTHTNEIEQMYHSIS